jgi:hypothetical protein
VQRLLVTALLVTSAVPCFAQAQSTVSSAPSSKSTALQRAELLARAHELYNQRQYDEAIRLSEEAGRAQDLADAASVVSARAHLERYRDVREPADLDAARTALTMIVDANLSARDHVDWTIGFGELLYFDRRFNTAAEFFETALGRIELLESGARERLLEWWASALDQQAQFATESERPPLYMRVLARSEEELRRENRSLVASYWIAVAALGLNDVERAWGAAEAAWLRASSGGPADEKLRQDLDVLMASALIPERARRLSPTADPRPVVVQLQQEWTEFKERYGKS